MFLSVWGGPRGLTRQNESGCLFVGDEGHDDDMALDLRIAKCQYCDILEALPTRRIRACSRCKVVGYCSKSCQRADWKIHKSICKTRSHSQHADTIDDVVELEPINQSETSPKKLFIMSEKLSVCIEFVSSLQLMIEERYIEEAFFDRLATLHHGRAARVLTLMAEIERNTIVAMQNSVARHDLTLVDSQCLRDKGRRKADAIATLTWVDKLDKIHNPASYDDVFQICNLAPTQSDKVDFQLLVDHHTSYTDFVAAEREGNPNSINILFNFLHRFKYTRGVDGFHYAENDSLA